MIRLTGRFSAQGQRDVGVLHFPEAFLDLRHTHEMSTGVLPHTPPAVREDLP